VGHHDDEPTSSFFVGDFGEEGGEDGGVETGYGGRVGVGFAVRPGLGVYVDYGVTEFNVDLGAAEAFLDDDAVSIMEQGFGAGVQADFPSRQLSPYLRGGLVYRKIGFRLSDEIEELLEEELGLTIDEDDLESELSLGFHVEGGVTLPLGSRVSALAGLGYTSFKPRYDSELEITEADNVTYINVDLGLRIRI
jgi:hypothetical protein